MFTNINVKTVLFRAIQFSLNTQSSSICPMDRTLYSGPEWTREQWQWRGTPHSLKLQYYWNLTIRLFFCHILDTCWGEVLPLCREAVSVFYHPLPTGQKCRLCGDRNETFNHIRKCRKQAKIANIFHFLMIRGVFNKFPDFFVRAFKIVVDSWKFTVIAIHLMKWLTNFYDFRFKWIATPAIGIHPTRAWLSRLVNFKSAIWTWGHFRRTICNKILF